MSSAARVRRLACTDVSSGAGSELAAVVVASDQIPYIFACRSVVAVADLGVDETLEIVRVHCLGKVCEGAR
jgi:hypothetical protein